jgi:peptidoglycan/xylan/chitin deacetylase (PgdA/CDA1 family)
MPRTPDEPRQPRPDGPGAAADDVAGVDPVDGGARTIEEVSAAATQRRAAVQERRAVRRRTIRRRRIGVALALLAVVGLVGAALWSLRPTDGDAIATGDTSGGAGSGPTTSESSTTTTTTTTTMPPKVMEPLVADRGPIPVVSRIPTPEPVVFITIDDGALKDPAVLEVVRRRNLPVTAFLTRNQIKDNPGFFAELQAEGGVIGSHSMSHANLKRLDSARQRAEICGMNDEYAAWFGTPPRLFRPPYGNWNATTLEVAASCGITSVVMWNAIYEKGVLTTQGPPLRNGDIILMHFRPELPGDLDQLADALALLGLAPADLGDYLLRPTVPPTTTTTVPGPDPAAPLPTQPSTTVAPPAPY